MITASVEELTPVVINELQALLPAHYDELSEHRLAGIPLDPQYSLYLARAEAGQVIYVALREAGSLVGYLVAFVAPGMHYRTCLTSTADIFYVQPGTRGKSGGMALFDAWKRECGHRGVKLMQIGMKCRHAEFAGALIRSAGFEQAEIMFWRFLDKDDG